jgi:hypothetical protein
VRRGELTRSCYLLVEFGTTTNIHSLLEKAVAILGPKPGDFVRFDGAEMRDDRRFEYVFTLYPKDREAA